MAIKTPSKYQKEIFKAYNTTNSNIFISATAGSGKTTTMLELVNQTPPHKKVWMSAFNKSIADELKSRVRLGVDVSTLHSKGMSLLRANLSCKLTVKELKSWIFGKRLFHDFLDKKYKNNEKDKSIYLFTLSRLVDLYRMNLVDPTFDNLTLLSERYGVDADPLEIEQTLKLIEVLDEYNSNPADELMIDFTDMLWLTHKFVKKQDYPKYHVVFIDELQDLNPLQKRLIDNSIASNGRFVAVGDENQTIYSFQGSNLDSLNAFKNTPNTISLPLSVSYRCAKSIVKEASRIFTGIEYAENAIEGIVRTGDLDEIRSGDFVLCRNNLPIVERYIDMLSWNRKSYILGRDFGRSLMDLTIKVDKVEDLDIILQEKKKALENKGVVNVDSNPTYQSLKEKCQIIRILFNRWKSLEKVKINLESMFKEDSEIDRKNAITFSTIHKSKGLEAERVFIINRELLPSKYAKTELELHQEKCLEYVAITRAKRELVYVKTSESLDEIPM